jgi:hypothetical protein
MESRVHFLAANRKPAPPRGSAVAVDTKPQTLMARFARQKGDSDNLFGGHAELTTIIYRVLKHVSNKYYTHPARFLRVKWRMQTTFGIALPAGAGDPAEVSGCHLRPTKIVRCWRQPG